MKPPPFEYEAPTRLQDALALLAANADEAKVLAGGQSLVPLLSFRLARPEQLIDLNRIGELAYLRRRGGVLHMGAMTRQRTLERSEIVRQHWPLLRQAVAHVAHAQIRSRGTVGGSAAHADPAAELPVALAALQASFHVRSATGSRVIEARDFFLQPLVSAIEPGELLVEIEVPPMAPGAGTAFVEFARRNGDFALGGVAAVVEPRPDGTCARVVIALLGAGPTPLRAAEAEASLAGSPIDERAARAAAATAVRDLRPTGDVHGSTEYRRELLQTLVERALLEATANASAA